MNNIKEQELLLSNIFASFNSTEDFINSVHQLPASSEELNISLLKRYRAGEQDIGNYLVNINLKLIVKLVNKFYKKTNSYDFFDCLNVAIIGFKKAIEGYDFDKNEAKFSTYASMCMYRHLERMLKLNDSLIKRPVYFVDKIIEYNKIRNERILHSEPLPSDDEWCKILKVTKKNLQLIKEDYLLETTSLNSKLGEDDDSIELGDIVAEELGNQINVNSFEDKSLLAYLKESMPPHYFYVLYNRVFTEEKMFLWTIGDKFGISTERVRQIEIKVLKQLKSLYIDGTFKYRYSNLKEIDSLDLMPVDPEDIIKYLFFRHELDKKEKQVYKLIIEGKYNESKNAEILGISLNEYLEIVIRIRKKTSTLDTHIIKLYDHFKSIMIKTYGTKIYKLVADIVKLDDESLNEKDLSLLLDELDYESALRLLKENNVSSRTLELLKKYFNNVSMESYYEAYVAEAEVNSLMFGLTKSKDLPIKKLYNVLLQNRDKFSDEQVAFLKMFKFGMMSQKEFKNKYPNSPLWGKRNPSCLEKLERLYFNVPFYGELNFTKDHYLQCRSIAVKKIDASVIDMLDLFYGVECGVHTYEEIANLKSLSVQKVVNIIENARDRMVSILTNSTVDMTIDDMLYKDYIFDESIDLSDDARRILNGFLIEHKSYDELAKMCDKNKTYVSHMIGDAINKIDGYRFGIFGIENIYSKDDLEEALRKMNCTSEEKSIIKIVLETGSRREVNDIYGKNKVKNLMERFYGLCRKIKTSNVNISFDDIESAIKSHVSERIINENERYVLSYMNGIMCDLNPKGEKISCSEFTKYSPKMAKKYYNSAMEKIRSLKLGITRAKYAYMKREELQKVLRDERLPISFEDRELLYYLFELNGYPYMELDELASFYGSLKKNLLSRVQKIFITIYKYLNNEVSYVSFTLEDLLANLKYFSRTDREILIDKFQNKLSNALIAEKMGMSKAQVDSLVSRLKFNLKNLIDGYYNGFDFDYFYDHLNDETIPYYGNMEIAQKVFYLHYEKHLTYEEILKLLALDCDRQTLSKMLSSYTLAVLKRQSGITKPKTYSYEEIREYYLEHSNEMSPSKINLYRTYFERIGKGVIPMNAKANMINPAIIVDLMKENGEEVFDINCTTDLEVKQILRKYKYRLSNKAISSLLKSCNMETKCLMSGKEQMKILRLLSKFNKEEISLSKKVA